jgi:hypothetical protein
VSVFGGRRKISTFCVSMFLPFGCFGALFFGIWRFAIFALGPPLSSSCYAVERLWVWPLRPGPGIAGAIFWGRRLGTQNGHMQTAETYKNKAFFAFLHAGLATGNHLF